MAIIDKSPEISPAFDPFRQILSILAFQATLLEFLILRIAEAWGMKAGPILEYSTDYPENDGRRGFQELVIPLMFKITPFFSRND